MNTHIDQVRDINFDIRLKALNAVIRSSRLGDAGRAITSIVNEMKELAEQSNATIGAVTNVMERIAEASHAMDQTGRADLANDGSAGALLRKGIENFSWACTNFKQHSGEALEMGCRLEARIAESRRHIDFFQKMRNTCRQHHERLDEVKSLLQPFADAAPEDWLAEEKKIIERYTMDREREAHLGMAAAHTSQTNIMAMVDGRAGNCPAAGVTDFDDNVELF
jgi:hypothetical protein